MHTKQKAAAQAMLDALCLAACVVDNWEAHEMAFDSIMEAIDIAKAAGFKPSLTYPEICALMRADETMVN